jgi:hypothetical protein
LFLFGGKKRHYPYTPATTQDRSNPGLKLFAHVAFLFLVPLRNMAAKYPVVVVAPHHLSSGLNRPPPKKIRGIQCRFLARDWLLVRQL